MFDTRVVLRCIIVVPSGTVVQAADESDVAVATVASGAVFWFQQLDLVLVFEAI